MVTETNPHQPSTGASLNGSSHVAAAGTSTRNTLPWGGTESDSEPAPPSLSQLLFRTSRTLTPLPL